MSNPQRKLDEESGYTAADTGMSKMLKRYRKKIINGPYQPVRYRESRTTFTQMPPTKGFPPDENTFRDISQT